jgi:hypothetical protein
VYCGPYYGQNRSRSPSLAPHFLGIMQGSSMDFLTIVVTVNPAEEFLWTCGLFP